MPTKKNKKHRALSLQKGTYRKYIFIDLPRVALCSVEAVEFTIPLSKLLATYSAVRYLPGGCFSLSRDGLNPSFLNISEPNATVALAIIEKKSEHFLGCLAFTSIDWVSKLAEVVVILQSEADWKKKNIAHAVHVFLKYGFTQLGLHKIQCKLPASHYGMKQLMEEAGFRTEGVRKEAFYGGGTYHDLYEFGIFSTQLKSIF